MSTIRYICISDLHLGIETSLLTNVSKKQEVNFDEASPVLVALAACLRSLIENSSTQLDVDNDNDDGQKPVLILCGDVLEFALAPDNLGAMAFKQFIEHVLPEGRELFSEIIYIPGNHDHHIWESARETQYSNYIATLKADDTIKPPWFTTRLFLNENAVPVMAGLPSSIVKMFSHLRKEDFSVRAAYPNFGLINHDNKKCVVFHHGHYTESIYSLMSSLNTLVFPGEKFPQQIWELEADNHAWIDFFWSMLGRSGDTGRDISMAYNERDNEEFVDELIKNLSDNVAEIVEKRAEIDLTGLLKSMSGIFDAIKGSLHIDQMQKEILSMVLQRALKAVAEKILATEKDDKSLLSDESKAELIKYLDIHVYNQILDQACFLKIDQPDEMVFVFGHTHKPFEDIFKTASYKNEIPVYNTGGWMTEGLEPNPMVGGAVICLDEELTPVSIRMFNDSISQRDFKVRIEEAVSKNCEHSLFYDEVANAVNADRRVWNDFSQVVAKEIKTRRNMRRLREKTSPAKKDTSLRECI
jgi:UDP-2,3-diacylglucosamine pyrophosphatase LpxH